MARRSSREQFISQDWIRNFLKFTNLLDVPKSFRGQKGKILCVNDAETKLILQDLELEGIIIGEGIAGQVTFWVDTNEIAGSNLLTFDRTTGLLKLKPTDVVLSPSLIMASGADAILFRILADGSIDRIKGKVFDWGDLSAEEDFIGCLCRGSDTKVSFVNAVIGNPTKIITVGDDPHEDPSEGDIWIKPS